MEGLCSSHPNPDLWFPEEHGIQGKPTNAARKRSIENALKAIAICQKCPVRARCLEEGMSEENIEYGIWGGYLAGERITLARSRRSGTIREQAIAFAEGVKTWQSTS